MEPCHPAAGHAAQPKCKPAPFTYRACNCTAHGRPEPSIGHIGGDNSSTTRVSAIRKRHGTAMTTNGL
eukprot:1279824-Lingulodinium_polyedra.AAC.1